MVRSDISRRTVASSSFTVVAVSVIPIVLASTIRVALFPATATFLASIDGNLADNTLDWGVVFNWLGR